MILLAVSGGIDSMCLMEKVRLSGEPFAVAHCNFGLRGADSDGDEALVRSRAAGLGVSCHVKRFDTQEIAAAEGISIEMAARRLRYHWFGELCRDFGYTAVAVAHNANDNAETLILNLLRGTGVRGILGMKVSGYIPDPDFGHIPLLRPLLSMTRADIEAFAAEHGLEWREDATNALNDYKRNKIRNLVFPVFREINPKFVETLNRDMERFAQEMPDQVGHDEREEARHCRLDRQSHNNCHSERSEESIFIITEEEWDGTKPVKQPSGMLIMDADKAGELVEGRWETGDWIKPLGAPGKKKMQDWFTDHHIGADEKPFVPLMRSPKEYHHILAVVGYCIDNSVKVTKSTKRIIRISVKKD